MMKTYLKNTNGITIMILIITILVMLILAGVGISAIAPGGMLNKVQDMEESIPLQQAVKDIHNALDYKYYLNSGRELTEADEGIVESLAKIIIETGIPANKFVIYCDEYKTSINNEKITIMKDLIFYRYDLITADELDKISNYDEISGMFMGDANLDGVLSQEDVKIVEEIENEKMIIAVDDIRFKLCDVNLDGKIKIDKDIGEYKKDSEYINEVVLGNESIETLYE